MGKKQARRKRAARKRRAAAIQTDELQATAQAPEDTETSDDTSVAERPGRPFFVWVICIYFILNGAYAIVLTAFLLSGMIAVDEGLTGADYLFSALYRAVSALYIAGGITLFTYRKASFTIFLAATIMLVLAHALFAITTGGLQLDPDQLFFYLPDLLILTATTVYAGRLIRSGYLR